MLQRPFGATALTVSAVGFGAGHIGEPDHDDGAAGRLLHAALDAGITFVDTARGYGLSEERIGRHLARRRDEFVLSTKVGYDVPGEQDWTAAAVRGGVERALRVLATDVLDVVFLHSCSREVLERGEAVEALLGCVTDGTVRVPGYSGENDALAWAVDSGAFAAVQTSVNLVDQWSLHHVLPRAAERGIAVVAKRPIANAPWRHRTRPDGAYGAEYWDRLHELALGPDPGRGWLGTALGFSAFAPEVSTAIVGTGSPEHLAEAVEAAVPGAPDPAERRRWREAYAPHAQEWPGLV
ncbi:MAG: aldo/keto reductase [Nocardioidaceae bacterium]